MNEVRDIPVSTQDDFNRSKALVVVFQTEFSSGRPAALLHMVWRRELPVKGNQVHIADWLNIDVLSSIEQRKWIDDRIVCLRAHTSGHDRQYSFINEVEHLLIINPGLRLRLKVSPYRTDEAIMAHLAASLG